MGARSVARILVVDDDMGMRQVLSMMLRRLGHETIEAETGDEAIALLIGTPGIDLVTLDLVMPGLSGLKTLEIIRGREEFKNLPVIMISAFLKEGRIKEAVQAGASQVLHKPVSFHQLEDLVSRLLRKVEE